MANSGYLRTVSFGGFDKKDVLSYMEDRNTKICNLEARIKELEDQQAAAPAVAEGNDASDNSELINKLNDNKDQIAKDRQTIAELNGNIDTLKLQISALEGELEEKNADIQKLKEEKVMLEEKLQSATSGQPSVAEASFDIGSVFIEAKHSADRVVLEAKNAAKRMEDDSKILAQQVVDEANASAKKIVDDAEEKAKQIISKAQTESDATVAKANEYSASLYKNTKNKRDLIEKNFNFVTENIEKLANCLNQIVDSNVLALSDAKKIIETSQDTLANVQIDAKNEETKKSNSANINTNNVYSSNKSAINKQQPNEKSNDVANEPLTPTIDKNYDFSKENAADELAAYYTNLYRNVDTSSSLSTDDLLSLSKQVEESAGDISLQDDFNNSNH